MPSPALLALALAAAAVPPGQPAAAEPTGWLCERNWSRDGITVSVARYLSPSGRQREMYVEWEVAGPSGLVLSGFAGSDEAPRDIPLTEWSVHVGWPVQVTDAIGFNPMQLVLGPPREGRLPPGADRPGSFKPGLDMKWSALRRHFRGSKLEASLVDQKGRVLKSGAVELRRVEIADARARQEAAASRDDVRRYRTRCKPFDPRVTIG